MAPLPGGEGGDLRGPVALREANWPDYARQAEYNYQNQFELPVLFYLLGILSVLTRQADLFFVVAAWIFVATRVLHAFVHLTSNRLALRGPFFIVGAFVLTIMWLMFVVRFYHGQRMTPAARISAAIEVVADIAERRRPASDALKDWGLSHRFAGSGDRAAIAGLVYDALRRRASSAWLMGEDTPRAVVLGMLRRERGLEPDAVAALADGSRFAPSPLTDEERDRLAATDLESAPAHVMGDYPEWLDASLARAFGDERVQEGEALAARAPHRPAGQHAAGRPRRARRLRCSTSRRSRRAGRRMACASGWSPGARSPADPCRAGLPATDWSKSRTRALSSPR